MGMRITASHAARIASGIPRASPPTTKWTRPVRSMSQGETSPTSSIAEQAPAPLARPLRARRSAGPKNTGMKRSARMEARSAARRASRSKSESMKTPRGAAHFGGADGHARVSRVGDSARAARSRRRRGGRPRGRHPARGPRDRGHRTRHRAVAAAGSGAGRRAAPGRRRIARGGAAPPRSAPSASRRTTIRCSASPRSSADSMAAVPRSCLRTLKTPPSSAGQNSD